MDDGRHQIVNGLVYQTMACELRLAGKPFRDDPDRIVPAATGGTGMSHVLCGIVVDIQGDRMQRLFQPLSDRFDAIH